MSLIIKNGFYQRVEQQEILDVINEFRFLILIKLKIRVIISKTLIINTDWLCSKTYWVI